MPELEIAFLGGQGEIGKNMLTFRYGSDMLVVDCGMKFPEEEMYGIDVVIPDFSYVIENAPLVRGMIVTHGHEDHIGGLPYFFKRLKTPLYGTRLTLSLAEEKLKEQNVLNNVKFNFVEPRDRVTIGCFEVEFIRVCHSIPEGVALAVKTPVGTVIYSADFKIDYTPVDGKPMDINRFAGLGEAGVLALLSDSTNADVPGYTPSERSVGETLEQIFRKAPGRLIIATFASNLHRVQQVLNLASRYERKVAISGRSMEIIVRKARELGYMEVPSASMVSLDDLKNYPVSKTVIITTGSQGEPMSALTRMSHGEHRQIEIQKGDTVVISAIPVPGNEKYVDRTVDNLCRRGAEVIYEQRRGVHVSGHAAQEELKLLLSLVKPKVFLPIHGEYRHLVCHRKLAEEIGIPNIILAENGDRVMLTQDKAYLAGSVAAGQMLVDGLGVGEIGAIVLRERKALSEDGVVVVSAVISRDTGGVVSEPRLESKGFVYVKESEKILLEAAEKVRSVIGEFSLQADHNPVTLEKELKEVLSKYFYQQTRRRPTIITVITAV